MSELKYLKKIPKTSINKYVSKYYALNTPIGDKLPADWHPYCWFTDEYGEEIELMDNWSLGESGILYKKIPFSKTPVYIASYPRAVVDILFMYHTNGLDICKFGKNLANEFLTSDEKKEMFVLLIKMNKNIDISEYIKNEFPKGYYEMRYKNVRLSREKN